MKTVQEYIAEYFNKTNLSHLPSNAIFLVGSNPLPVYVAGIALKPKKIFLLGTDSVGTIIDTLKSCLRANLNLAENAISSATCNPADSCDIRFKTQSLLEDLPDADKNIWLGYTTGTKAMAVHCHETWKNHHDNNNLHWAIYLSSDGPNLWFDTIPMPFALHPNSRYSVPEPPLKEILDIHQIDHANSSRHYRDYYTCTKHAGLAEKIHHWIVNQTGQSGAMKHYLDLLPPTYAEQTTLDIDGRKVKISGELSFLNESNFNEGSCHVRTFFQDWANAIDFKEVSTPTLDILSEWLDGQTAKTDKMKRRLKTLKWIATEWLETWVAKTIVASGLFRDVHEGFEFKVPRVTTKAEVDVCAMRGHTPFVFSCTVDSKIGLNKHKLFEVRLRANQLGGEHARAAVVCLSETPETIRQVLNQGWSGYETIEVFGLNDIRSEDTFIESLKIWIQKFEK